MVGSGDRSEKHPHLQLPAEPRHRPPRQPDAALSSTGCSTASSTRSIDALATQGAGRSAARRAVRRAGHDARADTVGAGAGGERGSPARRRVCPSRDADAEVLLAHVLGDRAAPALFAARATRWRRRPRARLRGAARRGVRGASRSRTSSGEREFWSLPTRGRPARARARGRRPSCWSRRRLPRSPRGARRVLDCRHRQRRHRRSRWRRELPDARGRGRAIASPRALAVARGNVGAARAAACGSSPATCWHRFAAAPFDLVVSQSAVPAPTARSRGWQPEVRDFEPRLALDGGAGRARRAVARSSPTARARARGRRLAAARGGRRTGGRGGGILRARPALYGQRGRARSTPASRAWWERGGGGWGRGQDRDPWRASRWGARSR